MPDEAIPCLWRGNKRPASSPPGRHVYEPGCLKPGRPEAAAPYPLSGAGRTPLQEQSHVPDMSIKNTPENHAIL